MGRYSKYLDFFLWKDFFKVIRKKHEVAFVIDNLQAYNTAMASVRMRCYDIISFLESRGIRAELYKENKKYDIVIFTKTSSDKAAAYAEKLSKENIPIIYDAYCNYFDDKKRTREIKNVLSICAVSSAIITCSEKQRECFLQFHKNVYSISEGIIADVMKYQKKHLDKKNIVLVYCGYAEKAGDTLYIKDVIHKLQKEKGCKVLYICQRDPFIREFEYEYIKYNQRKIGKQLCKGDIMIAPRDMSDKKNYEHSFTKAALPMAIGLPVVASPIPSYVGSPVLLCESMAEWEQTLEKLILSKEYRTQKAEEGIAYIRKNYLIDVIGEKYLKIIKECI